MNIVIIEGREYADMSVRDAIHRHFKEVVKYPDTSKLVFRDNYQAELQNSDGQPSVIVWEEIRHAPNRIEVTFQKR